MDLPAEFVHVSDLGLEQEPDARIWELASSQQFTIVSKDDDFRELAALHGPPPKVVLLKVGNCSLKTIEDVRRRNWAMILKLHEDDSASLLHITLDTAFLLLRGNRE